MTAAGTNPDVDRRAGTSRYDTAIELANYGAARFGEPSVAYVSTGANYPDALGGGVLAGIGTAGHWQPVLLTTPLALSAQDETFLGAHAGVQHAVILGGTAAVSATAQNRLFQVLP